MFCYLIFCDYFNITYILLHFIDTPVTNINANRFDKFFRKLYSANSGIFSSYFLCCYKN